MRKLKLLAVRPLHRLELVRHLEDCGIVESKIVRHHGEIGEGVLVVVWFESFLYESFLYDTGTTSELGHLFFRYRPVVD